MTESLPTQSLPTKALVHSAQVRREGDQLSAYFRRAVERRDSLIDKINAANRAMPEPVDQVRLVVGAAVEFTGPRQVRVTTWTRCRTAW